MIRTLPQFPNKFQGAHDKLALTPPMFYSRFFAHRTSLNDRTGGSIDVFKNTPQIWTVTLCVRELQCQWLMIATESKNDKPLNFGMGICGSVWAGWVYKSQRGGLGWMLANASLASVCAVWFPRHCCSVWSDIAKPMDREKGSQHLSPNVNIFWNFETHIWLEIITSRDAKSACFKGSQTSCTDIISYVFLAEFWPKKITSRDVCVLLRVMWWMRAAEERLRKVLLKQSKCRAQRS